MTANPSEIAREEEEAQPDVLDRIKEKVLVLRAEYGLEPGNANGPRVPPMSARKRRRRHVRSQRRVNR